MIKFKEELAILWVFTKSHVQESFCLDHHFLHALSSQVPFLLVVEGEASINSLGMGCLEHLWYYFLHIVFYIKEG